MFGNKLSDTKAFHFMTRLICFSQGVPAACLLTAPDLTNIHLWHVSEAMLCSFVAAYPFCAPVKLALGDLCYTNPVERDTEHSFITNFSPNTQAKGKQINQINIYAGLLQCSQKSFTQQSILCVVYSTDLWVLLHVRCDEREWLHKPDLASVLFCSGATVN